MELGIEKKYIESGGSFDFTGVIQLSILMKDETKEVHEIEKEHSMQFEVSISLKIAEGSITEIDIPFDLAREKYFKQKDDVLTYFFNEGINIPIGIELISFNNRPIQNPEMDIFIMKSTEI